MTSTADEYKELRAATTKLREQLDALKASGDTGGSLDVEAVELLVRERESWYKRVDYMAEWIASGGPDELGAAMSSDFARLRELGEA